MSFGQNLQFLRRMRRMTQEQLAERLTVSRQTVSKWEVDAAYPEMDKLIELCELFSCSMDQIIRENMNTIDEAYSNLRFEWMEAFSYIRYAVISTEPEWDAISHVSRWAERLGISEPKIIGWDFPYVSQEQINVYNMHGYAAALIIDDDHCPVPEGAQIIKQKRQRYAVITIKNPMTAPFSTIPNAYKTLLAYMKANGTTEPHNKNIIECFEREYALNGIDYMDVYIATD